MSIQHNAVDKWRETRESYRALFPAVVQAGSDLHPHVIHRIIPPALLHLHHPTMKKNRTIHLPGPALLLLLFVGLLLPAILGCNAVNSAVATLTAPTVTATPDATATPLPQVIAVPASSPSTDNSAVAPSEADLVALIDAAGLDFAERRTIAVYDRVAPSVVNITTQVLVRNFFGVAPEEGSGSGFVLDAEGHILTNYHVIEGAQQIEVSFSDATVLALSLIHI